MESVKLNSIKLHEALSLQQFQCFDQAEQKYIELLREEENAEILRNLGVLYGSMERHQDAVNVLQRSVELEPSALQYYSLALALEAAGEPAEAVEAYQQAIDIDPEWMDARNNLGNVLAEAGRIENARAVYLGAIEANAEHPGSYINLGNLLLEESKVDEALQQYLQAMLLNPRDPNLLYNLGVVFQLKGLEAQSGLYFGYSCYYSEEYKEAIGHFRKLLTAEKGDVQLYTALAICCQLTMDYAGGIEAYRMGIKEHPHNDDLWFLLGLNLQEGGETEEAIRTITKASELLPESLTLKLQSKRIIPILYDSVDEIDYYRKRFVEGLREPITNANLVTEKGKQEALKATGTYTNFYLQYQGRNDLELQKEYGEYLHKVMAANFPQWAKALEMPPVGENGKIRIGYASFHLYNHSGGRWALGWLKNHDRNKFEIYTYQLGPMADKVTQQFRAMSDQFKQLPGNIEEISQQIRADDLHVMIWTDIGMNATMSQLAAMRLAPVQCTTWGHPITSGLPTVDYYLSSAEMEPENAQEHYTEKLINLPNTGLCYPKPVVPQITKTRAEFGLREGAILYLSCQSLFKYLPQFDYIYPKIALKVPNCQFAFLNHHQSQYLSDKFRSRLKRAFAKYNLNSEDYCVLVPRQNSLGFANLNLVSDIFLDTFTWSGGNTTFEAIAYGLPVVTCPGEFMRGRHSLSILKTLGITETIAINEDDYINVAVNLGTNECWRKDLSRRMKINEHLFEDKACVEALDQFFIKVVGGKA